MPVSRILRITALVLLAALVLLTVSLSATAQAPSPGQLEEGSRLFAENCAVCHGADGQGRIGATLAKNWPSVRPDLTVRTIITNGVPGSRMPAWSQEKGGPLTGEQIDALTAYILSWQTGGSANIIILPTPTPLPPVTPVPNVSGDTTRGAALFQQNCIMCHGEGGQGKIGRTLAKNWAGARPDLLIQNTIKNGIPNTTMPAWSVARGGPLSNEEINDLTAYILAMPPVTQVQTPTEPPGRPDLSWLSGWGGVIVFLVLVVIVFGFAYWIQNRK
jgi:ubiquinol-cytochrome c reductase cytochrome c subunit